MTLYVLKAWDYAQTIFRSEKLRIAYINVKAEIGPGKHLFLMFRVDCMVMHTVFMLSMYHGYVSWRSIMTIYVSWLCIMAMYLGYVSWLCTMAVYHGYVSGLCIMDMYFGYVF